mmetsp:Transcript_112458/g.157711  ORF Transcript_112458/g.157711 Transcript_112458/m.157711 type:complete len:227 (-) Transcript_112458:257-937(-)
MACPSSGSPCLPWGSRRRPGRPAGRQLVPPRKLPLQKPRSPLQVLRSWPRRWCRLQLPGWIPACRGPQVRQAYRNPSCLGNRNPSSWAVASSSGSSCPSSWGSSSPSLPSWDSSWSPRRLPWPPRSRRPRPSAWRRPAAGSAQTISPRSPPVEGRPRASPFCGSPPPACSFQRSVLRQKQSPRVVSRPPTCCLSCGWTWLLSPCPRILCRRTSRRRTLEKFRREVA